MQTLLLLGALSWGAGLLPQDVPLGQGGTYRGPGDTVPPGSGALPQPGLPEDTGPGGGPGRPAPGAPVPRGVVTNHPRTPQELAIAASRAAVVHRDLSEWTDWWEVNRAPYLDLRRAVHRGSTLTGDGTWFLGHGVQDQSRSNLRPSDEQVRTLVVPALLGVLEEAPSVEVVTGAMIALAKIGEEVAGRDLIAPILPFVGAGNRQVAESAVLALGILASDAAVPPLSELLLDTSGARALAGSSRVDYRSRAFAAYGLGLIGARSRDEAVKRSIVRTLTRVLRAPDDRGRDVRVAALLALGLVPLSPPEAPPAHAERTLEPWESRGAQIDLVLGILDDRFEDRLVCAHAPTTLARLLGEPGGRGLSLDEHGSWKRSIARALLARLERGSSVSNEELESAVLALGEIGDTDDDPLDVEIREALVEVASETRDQQARCFSQIALGTLAGRAGSGPRSGRGHEAVRAALRRGLVHGKSRLRPWSGLGLGILLRGLQDDGRPPALELGSELRRTLADEGNPTRVAAYAIATGIARDVESKAVLLERLREVRDDAARGSCALALGMLGARDAIEPIQEVIRESRYRPELMASAAIALGLLGDKDLVPDLVDMLASSRSLASQASVATALGYIGDHRSLEPLVALLLDGEKTARARAYAAAALGMVADKEALPWNAKIGCGVNYRASAETLMDAAGSGVLNVL